MQAVLTLYRRAAANVMREWYRTLYRLSDSTALALEEYVEQSYPLDTASTWVLDQHWGPKFNVPRNGLNDADYRLFIKAQALLIVSAGRPDEILTILRLLLPTALPMLFTPLYPKAWIINIDGVPLTDETIVTINSAATGNYTITVLEQQATYAAIVPPDTTATIATFLAGAVTGLGLPVTVTPGPGLNEFTIKADNANDTLGVVVDEGDISISTQVGAGLVLNFLETRPSPEGGGFATAGENGFAIVQDAMALNFSSVHGAVTVTGWFSSVHGAVTDAAGWAHAGQL